MPLLLLRRLLAEFLGTGVLVATVVGSGVMATSLTHDVGLQLSVNALATVAVLGVIIAVLGPVSGAHFNPVVTLAEAVRRDMGAGEAAGYVAAQLAGGLAGTAVANLMFELPAWHASGHERTGTALWLGEVVATSGLLFTIGAITRTGRGHLGPVLVPAWIGAAYFFTSSTSFANPAVALARSASDTFAGIAPGSVPGFVLSQLVGAALGVGLAAFLFPRPGLPEPLDLPEAIHEHRHS
jgi:glycerol uptake facilitator-like aquaporin